MWNEWKDCKSDTHKHKPICEIDKMSLKSNKIWTINHLWNVIVIEIMKKNNHNFMLMSAFQSATSVCPQRRLWVLNNWQLSTLLNAVNCVLLYSTPRYWWYWFSLKCWHTRGAHNIFILLDQFPPDLLENPEFALGFRK